MKTTKEHILQHALKLFNANGFVNVRLQHIADSAHVSVGHLAYHFKNKDTIVEALFDELTDKQTQLLNEFRVVPLFQDLDYLLTAIYEVQKKYIFYYQDLLEMVRAFPAINTKHQQFIAYQQAQLALMIDFNIARGALLPIDKNSIDNIIWICRNTIDNWSYATKTDNSIKDNLENYKNIIWQILKPYFSDTGNREFQQIKISYNLL